MRRSTESVPTAGRHLLPQEPRFGNPSMRSAHMRPLPELMPFIAREHQIGDEENHQNIPNLLNNARGFLDYVERAAKKSQNKKKMKFIFKPSHFYACFTFFNIFYLFVP